MINKYILNSYNRYSGTNNNPTFSFTQPIIANTVYVNKVNIPYTYYNITDANNRIVWVASVGTTEISTFIPNGNYSIDELLTAIGVAMTDDAVGEDNLTYTATLNTTTLKITIENNTLDAFTIRKNTVDYPIAQTEDAPMYLLYQLGFFVEPTSGSDVTAVVELSGAGSYTASSTYYISSQNISVTSSLTRDAINYNSYTFYNKADDFFDYTTQFGINNILLNIPVNAAFGEQINYEVTNNPEILELKNGNYISSIDFKLVDPLTNLQLDLNGRSWCIELVFEK